MFFQQIRPSRTPASLQIRQTGGAKGTNQQQPQLQTTSAAGNRTTTVTHMKVGNTHIKQISAAANNNNNNHNNNSSSTTTNGPNNSAAAFMSTSATSTNLPNNNNNNNNTASNTHSNHINHTIVVSSPHIAGTVASASTFSTASSSGSVPALASKTSTLTLPANNASAANATPSVPNHHPSASATPTTPNTASKANASKNASSSASAAASAVAAAARAAAAAAKEKEKKTTTAAVAASAFYPQSTALSMASSMYGDDDINDVAAMGGVNLAEESQRILGSTELIGTQIRSCKDEVFLHMPVLQARLRQAMARHGLEEPSNDVAVLISHACQERIKNVVEKLAVIAEHRIDIIKVDPRYEVTKDVRGQIKFLEELDKAEQKRHEEQEREMLMRAAKSRSKTEDPEQAKLKAKVRICILILVPLSTNPIAKRRQKRCNVPKWKSCVSETQI